MKRKRGHQKGKQKQPATPKDVDEKLEENPALDDTDNAELGSPVDVEPSPSGEDEPAKHVEILPDKPAGPAPGRVKVKLKSSKMLDVQLVHSDAQTQNDSDTLSPQMGLEKQGEGVNSEGQPSSARKTGSIKIKSSRGLGSLNTIINQMSSPGERTTLTVVDRYKQSYKREHKLPRQVSRYNEQELNAALTVIKKVMKMDAADPFNVPVDPVALGIPDYFDIIKTPMDFGTICKNLEHGSMYMNSKDVFKDVQYIWENCYRYNNKGDYIIELMKRVKKNFMKYWVAAGLYTEQSNRVNDATLDHDSGLERPPEDDYGKEKVFQAGGRRTNSVMSKQEYVGTPSLNGTGSIQVETAAQSTRERLHVKNTNSKHKKRRGHGINKHKSDCLCAVCVVRRRRREREENAQIVASQIELSEGNMSQDFRKEETFSETPGSEDESLYSDCSPGTETTVKFEEQGVEVKLGKSQQHASQHEKRGSADVLEVQKTVRSEHSEQLQLGGRSGEEHNMLSQSEEMEDSGYMTQTNIPKGETPLQEREEEAQKQKQLELLGRQNQTKMYKNLLCDENPSIMKLCGSLFSNDRKSFWSGPHSLVRQDTSVDRSSAIHAAVAMLMK